MRALLLVFFAAAMGSCTRNNPGFLFLDQADLAGTDSGLDASIDDLSPEPPDLSRRDRVMPDLPPGCGNPGQPCCPGDVCSHVACCVTGSCVGVGDACGTGQVCTGFGCE